LTSPHWLLLNDEIWPCRPGFGNAYLLFFAHLVLNTYDDGTHLSRARTDGDVAALRVQPGVNTQLTERVARCLIGVTALKAIKPSVHRVRRVDVYDPRLIAENRSAKGRPNLEF
jgi:hypothetical protein